MIDPELDDIEDLLVEEDADEVFLEIKPKRKKREKKPAQEYVNKNEMWEEIRQYYELLGEGYDNELQIVKDKKDHNVDITNRLSTMIDDIATKLGYRPNFISYSYLSEMRGDAKVKMIKCIRDGIFKCWSRDVEIVEKVDTDKGVKMYFHCEKHWKKHEKLKDRIMETDDIVYEKDGKEFVTFKNNAFGYFSGIATNSFLNRIKKEKQIEETKRTYQEMYWENIMATEQFKFVRKPKIIDHDENEGFYEGE